MLSLSRSAVLFWSGLVLLSWFAYEEAIWQSYVHNRWGRIDFELNEIKSIVLLAASYLITAGCYLYALRQHECRNRIRMKILRFLLLAGSAVFAVLAMVASLFVVAELPLSKWDIFVSGLFFGLLAWMIATLLIAREVYRGGQ